MVRFHGRAGGGRGNAAAGHVTLRGAHEQVAGDRSGEAEAAMPFFSPDALTDFIARLIAAGGDLEPGTVLAAYRAGIFR